MPDGAVLSIFIPTALALVAIPGPNTLYIMARSMQQGLGAGLVSCLGIMVGTLVHITFAALGLSALVLSSVMAFNTLKCAGAAYLIYLGIKTLRSQQEKGGSEAFWQNPSQKFGAVFYQGIVINILNPKTALFFVAFLPQFVHVQKGSVLIQIVILGGILIALGGVSDMVYAFFAGRIGNNIKDSPRLKNIRCYGAGFIYIGLGFASVFAKAVRM